MRPSARAAALALCAALALVRPAAAAEELNLFAWSEYVPQAVIDGFTKKTGIRVSYETYASNEEMLAKLLSGAERYDLIQPSEYVVAALVKEGRLEKLDHAKLPHLANLDPAYTHLPHDPGLAYSVPYMSGTVGIVVDTTAVKEPVTGYADVFTDAHRNRIVVLNDSREIVSWAMDVLGLDINDPSPANLAKATPLLERWLPLVRVYDSDSPKTALLNGDVDLGVVWSGEAAILIDEDPTRFTYVLPKEGAHRFVDSLAIPAGARHVDAAHRFIDYVLEPAVSVQISAEFPYTNPNAAARKLLSRKQLANVASYPPGDPKLETFADIGERAVAVDKLVTDVKAKSGR
jgi:spermidine/putrescine transport system permease protein